MIERDRNGIFHRNLVHELGRKEKNTCFSTSTRKMMIKTGSNFNVTLTWEIKK